MAPSWSSLSTSPHELPGVMRTARTFNIRCAVLALTIQTITAIQVLAGEDSGHRGAVVGLQSGYGNVHLRSDQGWNVRQGTFSLGFQAGYALSRRLVIGLEAGGWLIEPFSYGAHGQEEERGEAVSNTMVFIHMFPLKRLPLYLRTGLGESHYKHNNWDKTGGNGWGAWLLGGGYELRISSHFYGAAQLTYSRGHFSDVPDILGRETGRRYEVMDISVALHWYSRK